MPRQTMPSLSADRVSHARRLLGRAALATYRLSRRVYAKVFSSAIGGAFATVGAKTVLEPPIRIVGEWRMAIGRNVFIGANSWLQADPSGRSVVLVIGDGTSIAGNCVLSAVHSLSVGRHVLIARGVYVADHSHAFEDTGRAVLDQGVARIEAVEIGDGAWLGENVVVGPGVRIGTGAVVGANSVVLDDVPDFAVAVGAPARVVRRFGPQELGSDRGQSATQSDLHSVVE